MSSVCRHNTQQSFFCITARVNVRKSISDLLGWKLWVQIPEVKNMSSVFRHNNQQTFFLHSRQSQNTQFHFRFSGLKIVSSDFRTQKCEFSFPDLKKWIQFSDTILNSHFIAITPQSINAIPFQIFRTYNYEFRLPNLKIWDHFSGLKKMSLVFRT